MGRLSHITQHPQRSREHLQRSREGCNNAALPDARNASSFVGSIPELYDRHLGPVFFDPSAADLSARVDPAAAPLLDLAAGTGRLTAPLMDRLNGGMLVALDLNGAMQHVARARVRSPRVRFVRGDAMRLPFGDAVFSQVACQHGIMFFPDKARAASEVRRVLKPGGSFLLNVWTGLDENPLGEIADRVITRFFPSDPPRFYHVPFGYGDPARIRADLQGGGFRSIQIEAVDLCGPCASAAHIAVGLVKGSPIAVSIQERATVSPDTIVDALAQELERRFGTGAFVVPIKILSITASA
jgi:SAM-dependent methyltransferase